jgi:tRNA modification GTPase
LSARGDTIAAVATPPGQGSVAIVRVSGPDARRILEDLFRRRQGPSPLEPRRVYAGKVVDAVGGGVIDEVLAFVMPAPQSYTGEDVVEIQCHGGSVVTRRVLESVLAAGARAAAPGEFTKRAFLNGRLDLAQAEAVAAVIAARSEAGLRLARSQLDGHLSAHVGALRDAIIRARAVCEAALDFPEEDLGELDEASVLVEVSRVQREVEALTATFERARVRYEGARVVLVGKSNVGKSSLLNLIAGRERAIVTPMPGTTRDLIEAAVTLDGVPVVVVDTAGFREADDVVERLGVDRTHAAVAEASCAIAVFDRSRPLDDDDRMVAQVLRRRPAIAVVNKCDLPARVAHEDIAALVGEMPVIEMSALAGSGLDLFEGALSAALSEGGAAVSDEVVIFRARHRDAALEAAEELARAATSLAAGAPAELIASDLSRAAAALASITGEVTSEDVLDRVFAEFCIGK